jgi:hypothetical protein
MKFNCKNSIYIDTACCCFYPQPPKGGFKENWNNKSPLGDLGVKKVRVYTSLLVRREFIKILNPCFRYYIIFYLDDTFLRYEEVYDMVHTRTDSGDTYNTWSRQGVG